MIRSSAPLPLRLERFLILHTLRSNTEPSIICWKLLTMSVLIRVWPTSHQHHFTATKRRKSDKLLHNSTNSINFATPRQENARDCPHALDGAATNVQPLVEYWGVL